MLQLPVHRDRNPLSVHIISIKTVRYWNLHFRINPDLDLDVCLVTAKMLLIYDFVGVSHLTKCREHFLVALWDISSNAVFCNGEGSEKWSGVHIWDRITKWKSDSEYLSGTGSPSGKVIQNTYLGPDHQVEKWFRIHIWDRITKWKSDPEYLSGTITKWKSDSEYISGTRSPSGKVIQNTYLGPDHQVEKCFRILIWDQITKWKSDSEYISGTGSPSGKVIRNTYLGPDHQKR